MPLPTDILFRTMLKRAMHLHRAGKIAAAAGIYREIRKLRPQDDDLMFLLGTAELQLGHARESEALLEQSLARQPDRFLARINRGKALQAVGDFDGALKEFEKAVSLHPESARLWFDIGGLFLDWHRDQDAMGAFDTALKLAPDMTDAHYNRGTLWLNHGHPTKALYDFDAVLARDPASARTHNNRGTALRALHRYEDALAAFEAAAAHEPVRAANLYNRAIVLTELARPQEALEFCDRALKMKPDYAQAYCCRGNIMKELARYPEALAAYDKALALNPEDIQSRWDKSLVELLVGDFPQGWEDYELRWQCGIPAKNARDYPVPLWQGEDCAGQTVLVHAEQGFGDTIQFSRFIPKLAARGAKIVLEALPTLHPLLATLPCDLTLLDDGAPLPDIDFHVPVMSLARAFHTDLRNIPGETPYLAADPIRVCTWQDRLGPKTRPRIGLVWSGRAGLAPDRTRSMTCEVMTPLFDLDAEFHCLQKEIRDGDRETLKAFPQVQTHAEDLHDFADTAAMVSEMDLVIAVDTSLAHLSGALNKPLWVMLPFAPDWRWLLQRSDSPWYPTARLFRQDTLHDWPGVVANVRQALSDYLSTNDRFRAVP